MIIKLSEILQSIDEDEKSEMVNLDDWKLSEIDHLVEMGFEQDGDYKMILTNPRMVVYKKKEMAHQLPKDVQALGPGYVLEDGSKNKKYVFPTFMGMVEFFDNYEQDLKI
jgi:hypothetical protein